MTVTIVGTLEMIFTSGGETVSEAVHVNFESPTDVPLPLHESIVFTDRTPPVDIRIPLEAHLEDEDAHGFTDVTRVPVSRAGAMAEWTVARDGITRDLVLWGATPLVQEGIDWGATVVSDVGALWGYQSIPIGDGAEATGEASIAIGYNAKSTEESSTAMGHDAKAIGKQSLAVGRGSNAGGINSIAIGVDSDATGLDSTAVGQDANATNTSATAVGREANASGENATSYGRGAEASGINSLAVGMDAEAIAVDSVALGTGATALSMSSTAIGSGARVPVSSPGSMAFGYAAEIPENTPDHSLFSSKSLEIKTPNYLPGDPATTITLYDAAGNPHTVGVTANGLIVNGSPVGVGMPPPARGFQNLSQTRTTAGDINFTSATATIAGLQPNTDYNIGIELFLWLSTASAGTFRATGEFPTGGNGVLGSVTTALFDVHDHYWKVLSTRTSNASGEISMYPGIRWVSGSITSSRGEAILTVYGPA